MMQSPISNKKVWELAVAFVDNMDFFSNREEAMQKIRQIMATYAELFEAIGGKTSFEKTVYYC